MFGPSILPNGVVHREERPSLRLGVQPVVISYCRRSELGPARGKALRWNVSPTRHFLLIV